MKKILLLFTYVMLVINSSIAQTTKISGDPKNDLDLLFNDGAASVDIMDGVKTNPRQTELTYKLQQGIQANYAWFQEYMKTAIPGEPIKYHVNLGISKEEYEEFLSLANQIEVVSTGTETLTIIMSPDDIKFKGQDKTAVFNDVTIDIKNNKVLYKSYELEFSDVIVVSDNENGLKSKWKGYDWEFVDPQITKETDILTLDEFTTITFTIGQLNKNGKTYMKIKERQMVDGQLIIDNQVPIMF